MAGWFEENDQPSSGSTTSIFPKPGIPPLVLNDKVATVDKAGVSADVFHNKSPRSEPAVIASTAMSLGPSITLPSDAIVNARAVPASATDATDTEVTLNRTRVLRAMAARQIATTVLLVAFQYTSPGGKLLGISNWTFDDRENDHGRTGSTSKTEPFAGIAPIVVNDNIASVGTPGVATARRNRRVPRN